MGWNRNFIHGRCALNETITSASLPNVAFNNSGERGSLRQLFSIRGDHAPTCQHVDSLMPRQTTYYRGALGDVHCSERLGGTTTTLAEPIRSSFPSLLDLDSMFVTEVLYGLDIRPHVVVEYQDAVGAKDRIAKTEIDCR